MSVIEFEGKKPKIHPSVFLAPGSWVIGDVTLEEDVNVWTNAVIRGDDDSVVIGARTTILEGCLVEAPTGNPVEIGEDVIVSHGGTVHGAKIEDGAIIGIGLMIVAALFAVKKGFKPSGKVTFPEGIRRLNRSILSMMLMVIVLGGILCGFFTATQASAAAVIYSFLLAVVVYKKVSWIDLQKILKTTAVTTAFIFILIATSKAMGNLMVRLELPQMVSAGLLSLTDNKYLILLIINFILLFVGTFMDMTPAVLIFTPIFSQIAVTTLQMHPIHFGLIMIVNLCIGLCTPPVGTVLFVGCGVGGTTIAKLVKPMLPFYAAMITTLIIITYLPEKIILWLPRIISPNL